MQRRIDASWARRTNIQQIMYSQTYKRRETVHPALLVIMLFTKAVPRQPPRWGTIILIMDKYNRLYNFYSALLVYWKQSEAVGTRTCNIEIVNIARCKYTSKVPCWGLCFHFVVFGFVMLNIGPVLTVLSFHQVSIQSVCQTICWWKPAWLNYGVFLIYISWSTAQYIVQRLFRASIRSHFCIIVLTIGVNPIYNHTGEMAPCLWPMSLYLFILDLSLSLWLQ